MFFPHPCLPWPEACQQQRISGSFPAAGMELSNWKARLVTSMPHFHGHRQHTSLWFLTIQQRQKNRDGTCISGRELQRRKSFHTLGSPFSDGDGGWWGWKIRSHGGDHSNRGAESKVERLLHRGSVPTSTHQPERIVCSPAGVGGGWELRLGLQRSEPRERTGVGCMNKDWRGLVHHS